MNYDRSGGPPPPKRIKKSMTICQQQQLPPLTHDVINQILARLPVNTLQKFRCVCKSWNSLIHGDRYFVSLHLNNQSKKLTGFVSLSATGGQSNSHTLNYTSGSKIRKLDLSSRRCKYDLTNSCNGLVGVYSTDSFCVANPSIMKLTPLPRGSTHDISSSCCDMLRAAMGFDASTGEYKVVRLFVRECRGCKPVSVGCEVFCLGGGNYERRSWKLVKDPPVLRYAARFFPFFFSGAIYWTVEGEYVMQGFRPPEIALSFDLRDENFSVILHPKRMSRPKESCVVVLDGHLCVVDTSTRSARMKIWESKDHTNSKWVKQYRIDFSKIYKSVSIYSLMPMTVEEGWIVYGYKGRIIHYNPLTKSFFKKEKIMDNIRVWLDVPYTESLVWPWARW